jgi:membrane-bound serine protease (ClpP class)
LAAWLLVLLFAAWWTGLGSPSIAGQEPASEPTSAPTATEGSTAESDDGEGPGTSGEAESSQETADDAPEGPRALVGTIDSEIGLVSSAYLSRLLSAAEDRESPAVVIELNTFGGRVDAAVAMRDQILDSEIPVFVWINKRAISAGALISLACDKIAINTGGTIGAATPVMSAPGGQGLPQPVEEKYLSYFRQEMRVTAEATGRNGDIAEAMVDASVEVPGVSEEGKLLTLTTKTALETGIADLQASSLSQMLEELGFSPDYETLERTWSEQLVGFLTSPTIAGLLFLGMMIFGYMELQTPGFGVFGSVALACFLTLYFSHYLVNLAGWEELTLFVIGSILVLLEIFVIPGFGIAGITGILAIFASGVMLFMAGDWGDITITNPFTLDAVFRVFLSTFLGLVMILVMIRFLPDVGASSGRRAALFLGTTLKGDEGYTSHDAPEHPLDGAEGIALTPLRPSGRARLAGERVTVETEGEYVAKGEPVRVIKVSSGRVVVRPIEEPLEASVEEA